MDPQEILELGGAICGGMTRVFTSALASIGYRVREVSLVSSVNVKLDTHILTEVFVDGKWRVFDATFNVSYQDQGGNQLGVEEIRKELYYGDSNRITPYFHGEVAYPARIDSYYMNWRPLFANVSVLGRAERRVIDKISRLNYFSGNRKYVLTDNAGLSSTMLLQKYLISMAVYVLPTFNIVLFLVVVFFWRRSSQLLSRTV